MEYKDTIFLPKTSFEMRANLPAKEPAIIEEWDKENDANESTENPMQILVHKDGFKLA